MNELVRLVMNNSSYVMLELARNYENSQEIKYGEYIISHVIET
jgi:hypothetical protein